MSRERAMSEQKQEQTGGSAESIQEMITALPTASDDGIVDEIQAATKKAADVTTKSDKARRKFEEWAWKQAEKLREKQAKEIVDVEERVACCITTYIAVRRDGSEEEITHHRYRKELKRLLGH